MPPRMGGLPYIGTMRLVGGSTGVGVGDALLLVEGGLMLVDEGVGAASAELVPDGAALAEGAGALFVGTSGLGRGGGPP